MDGSDCRGYRTTRRNLPSSIAYRPPFTAISRNIGVIDMQTSHTTASAAATTSLARRIVAASWKPVLFRYGYSVTPQLQGLGAYPAVQALYIAHVAHMLEQSPEGGETR